MYRTKRRIAVVGAGISGLACAWTLSRSNEVCLFEASATLGGHANTVEVTLDGMTYPADCGFLVFNRRTYPNLCSLFEHLEVPVAPSEMTFSVSLGAPDFEWGGTDLRTLFAQPRNALRPGFWAMLTEIVRFNAQATRWTRSASAASSTVSGTAEDLTLGDFLGRYRYGRAFQEYYLLPMAGAIWSAPSRSMLEFPFASFARFCFNHGLLGITGRPQWYTVRGGSREYVRRLADQISRAGRIRAGTPVRSIARGERSGKLEVATDHDVESFDEVVLACHADQALALISQPEPGERAVLGAVRYEPNRAVLHSDASLLPRRAAAWAAWNYVSDDSLGSRPVGCSYLLNKLQPLPFSTPLVLTMNPPREPDPARVIASFDYAHPQFDRAAIQAQRALSAIQGRRGLWFCGAWAGFGFHEDGIASGLEVANAMGSFAPWQSAADTSRATVPAFDLAPQHV